MARYLQVLLLGCATTGLVGSETVEACDELGFDDQLQCDTCDEIKNFGLPDEIHDTCTKCCHEEEKETIKKYTSAKLIICQ